MRNSSRLRSYFPFIILKVSITLLLTLRLSNRIKPSCFSLSLYCKPCIPVTSLVALRWTLSINLISLSKWGLQIWLQYSRCGLTRVLYNEIIVSLDLSVKFHFIVPSILLAFFTTSLHCFTAIIFVFFHLFCALFWSYTRLFGRR